MSICNVSGSVWCMIGDFNSICSVEERGSRGSVDRVEDFSGFNQFIDDYSLINFPLCRCRYTSYRGDGASMSRLDHFLLSEDWIGVWPHCIQVALAQSISYHCSMMLTLDENNWGPRLTCMLNCWSDILGYKDFVMEKLLYFHIMGLGGFMLKEILKLIKRSLK